MADIPFLSTHRQTPIYTHPRPPARSPLSVRGFAPSATESPKSSSEGQLNLTNPPAFVRERPKAGGFKHIEMGPRICASKAQMPHPSGGYLRNLLRRAGSLGLPLFVLVFRRRRKHSSRRREKYTPKRINIAETSFQHSQTKTLILPSANFHPSSLQKYPPSAHR